MQNKAFSKILILMILVVLAGGGIFAWQYFGGPEEETKISEDETADWKTYRNEEYGFEIDYPQLIIYKEFPFRETRPNLVVLFTDDLEKISFGDLSLYITLENKPAESLDSYVDEIVKQKNEEGESAAAGYWAVVNKVEIGDQEGFEITGGDMSVFGWTDKTIYLEKSNYLYVIQYNYSATMVAQEGMEGMPVEEIAKWKEQGLEYDNIQKMLSTFRFLE